MVIHELDVVCPVSPPKADSPLVVDANTVLTGAIAFELFQAVAGRDLQVRQIFGSINETQFAQHESVELGREAPHAFSAEEPFCVPIAETVDHLQ